MAKRRVLLVEGKDDEHVIRHICLSRAIPLLDDASASLQPDGIEIKQQQNYSSLLNSLPIRLKESEVDSLGIVLDADTDVGGRWIAVGNRLAQSGYSKTPQSPSPSGTIIPSPTPDLLPRVGIWLMPDNKTPGILEDFLRFLVPSPCPLFDRVESVVAGIPTSERRFGRLAEPKAIIHTWLAWQEEPGRPLGTAIKARYLDPHVAEVNVFASWLNRLFYPDTLAVPHTSGQPTA